MFGIDLPVDVYELAATVVSVVPKQLELHKTAHEQSKGTRDLVTDLDISIEQELRNKLLAMLPGSSFAGEESASASQPTNTVYRWVLDPIDGTINFARGYEFYTSVACCLDASGPLIAVIYQPTQDIIAVAVRGQGCPQWRDASRSRINPAEGRILHVATHPWEQSVHSLMLTPKLKASARQHSFELASLLLDRTLGVRVLVSQAYEALKLAEGGVSGVISLQSSGGWSRDAARLVCESAGGKYTAIVNKDQPGIRGFILVDTPENFTQLLEQLKTVGYEPAD